MNPGWNVPYYRYPNRCYHLSCSDSNCPNFLRYYGCGCHYHYHYRCRVSSYFVAPGPTAQSRAEWAAANLHAVRLATVGGSSKRAGASKSSWTYLRHQKNAIGV